MVERADEEWKRLERGHKSREKTSERRIGGEKSSHARERKSVRRRGRERVCEEIPRDELSADNIVRGGGGGGGEKNHWKKIPNFFPMILDF